MCMHRGAPAKPTYGACNETHARWRRVRVPILSELSARMRTIDELPDIATINFREEWRYF